MHARMNEFKTNKVLETGNCVTGTIQNSDCYMKHNKSLRARLRITTELVLHNSAKLNEITNVMKL